MYIQSCRGKIYIDMHMYIWVTRKSAFTHTFVAATLLPQKSWEVMLIMNPPNPPITRLHQKLVRTSDKVQ